MRLPQKSSRPRSTALLSARPPTLTLPVHHSGGPWPRARRTLQLRGPVLLLSKHSCAAPEYAQTVVVLSASSAPRPAGAAAASLPGHKLWFEDSGQRDRFLAAAAVAIARSAGAAGRYVVQHEIGHGGYGVVYLVRRKPDGELFAMKAVNKVDVFSSDARLANLVAERVALAEAVERRSAFVVRLVDAFETDSHLCFVTELGSFGDLQGVFEKRPECRADENVVRQLFAEIVLGLEEVHRMGFLYRDLKLPNLLLNRNGHVRLADLGLAKRLKIEVEDSSVSSADSLDSQEEEEEDRFRLVGRTTSFVGTRRYMSPEHLSSRQTGGRGYGAPADMWALGVALYFMLTGKYPFGRSISTRDTPKMYDAIQNEKIEYPEWLTEECIGMLQGLLDRNSRGRFSFSEIKSHPWMRGIDWTRVRQHSVQDVSQEDVLNFIREREITKIEDRVDKSERVKWDGELISSVSGCSLISGQRGNPFLASFELLGFAYSNI